MPLTWSTIIQTFRSDGSQIGIGKNTVEPGIRPVPLRPGIKQNNDVHPGAGRLPCQAQPVLHLVDIPGGKSIERIVGRHIHHDGPTIGRDGDRIGHARPRWSLGAGHARREHPDQADQPHGTHQHAPSSPEPAPSIYRPNRKSKPIAPGSAANPGRCAGPLPPSRPAPATVLHFYDAIPGVVRTFRDTGMALPESQYSFILRCPQSGLKNAPPPADAGGGGPLVIMSGQGPYKSHPHQWADGVPSDAPGS